MGLDNGIVIKRVKKEQVPSYILDNYPMFSIDEEMDVIYWRKCWGLRRAVLGVLDPEHKYENDCEIPIKAEDVPALRKALKPFFDGEYWDENSDSIWEYKDYKDVLLQDWVNLCWLEEYLKNNPETECYFYDSY